MQTGTGRRPPARDAHAVAAQPDRAETLGLLIHALSKSWRSELDKRLRPLGLTRAQWQALLALSRAGGTLSQRELADFLDIGAPAMVALVDRMERDDLVVRSSVPGDRRRNAIGLTPRARRLLTTIHAVALELRHEDRSALTAHEKDQLCTLLGKARARLDGLKS
jgi:MarR family transcriptional regulator for hemolysin